MASAFVLAPRENYRSCRSAASSGCACAALGPLHASIGPMLRGKWAPSRPSAPCTHRMLCLSCCRIHTGSWAPWTICVGCGEARGASPQPAPHNAVCSGNAFMEAAATAKWLRGDVESGAHRPSGVQRQLMLNGACTTRRLRSRSFWQPLLPFLRHFLSGEGHFGPRKAQK